MSALARAAYLAWLAGAAGAARSFAGALEAPGTAQERLLASYLRRNRDTAYGRQYGFAHLRGRRQYQEKVPLVSWDDLVPAIDRIAAGEAAVLTREPVRLFEPSSGSTRAAKWIPVTASFQREMRRALAPWLWDLFRRRPDLLGGPAYWSVTPALALPEGGRPSVIPVGVESDSAYLGGSLRALVDATLAVPRAAARMPTVEAFHRFTLHHLLRRRDLRFVSVWHPSFLLLLLEALEERWEEILQGLEAGGRIEGPSGAAAVHLPPARRRARELRRLDPRALGAIWPRLQLISAWGDGPAASDLETLRRRWPGVAVEAKGLLATEAFVSVPFRGAYPLAVTSHVFELLGDRGRALLPEEAELGGVYSLVVTTGAGLYRYRLGDRVEVVGWAGGTPCVRFLGKEDRVSDLRGEKLSDAFVATAVEEATAVHLAHPPAFTLLAPETRAAAPRYVLYLEPGDEEALDVAAFGRDLDRALAANPHYAYARRLGQLGPAEVRVVPRGAFGRYAARLAATGQRLGDIKPARLSSETGWSEVLLLEGDGGSK